MVSLVLETPLTESDVAAILLEVTDHIGEVLLLQPVQLLERVSRGDVHIVLGLGLGGLERTG